MRHFGIVKSEYWRWVSENNIPAEAALIGVYLLTCPHSNYCGCYMIPKSYIAEDLGMGLEGVSKGLLNLSENGFIEYSEKTKHVFIPNYLEHNPPQNPNHSKGILKAIDSLSSKCEFKLKCLELFYKYFLESNIKESFRPEIEGLYQGSRRGLEGVAEGLLNPPGRPRPRPRPRLRLELSTRPSVVSENPKPSEDKKSIPAIPVMAIVNFWNANSAGLPQVKINPEGEIVSGTLAAAVGNAWQKNKNFQTLRSWEDLILAVIKMPFLVGENDRKWTVTLGWICEPGTKKQPYHNLQKILDGRYQQDQDRQGHILSERTQHNISAAKSFIEKKTKQIEAQNREVQNG